ncbi:MAG: DASS family sodium-coupled anion symporter [Gemmatimonadota bacterium]|nr:MAG: DASS family sodium-coupled anion symporter [Gemmatimonadota bacterium]
MPETESQHVHQSYSTRSAVGLFLGPLVFLILLIIPTPSGMTAEAQKMAAIALLMATWWVTEAIPIPATSLIPVALYPLLHISDPKTAAAPYANPLIFLFMGGFFIALAMQRWNLHRRIALLIIATIGLTPKRLILGFMIATAFLSMWISNTATTVMMMPIGLAVIMNIQQLLKENRMDRTRGTRFNFGTALMLGIAYSASIGGIGTLIGTPPNLILAGIVSEMYGRTIDFVTWMKVGIPLVCIVLPLAWLYLTNLAFPVRLKGIPGGEAAIRRELRGMGTMSRGERTVLIIFIAAALAWIFRSEKTLFGVTLYGLESFCPFIDDSTIAIGAAILLFLLPERVSSGRFILNWEWAMKIPWGALILFGGGLSLSKGFQISGLDAWIGHGVTGLQGISPIFITLIIVASTAFLTELTSNTATTAMLLPILGTAAIGMGQNPLLLMIPAAVAASLAFMLPVATPPNAVVYGSGYVRIPDMARAGLGMNLIGIMMLTILTYIVAMPAFGIILNHVPGWAR